MHLNPLYNNMINDMSSFSLRCQFSDLRQVQTLSYEDEQHGGGRQVGRILVAAGFQMELCSDWPFGLLGHRLRLSMQDTKNFV
jgi:hypothetical protein